MSAPTSTVPSGRRRDIPGLPRVRMLVHELRDEVHDSVARLGLWAPGAPYAVLRAQSPAGDAARAAVCSAFQQAWQVAREVFAAESDPVLSSRSSGRLPLTFLQCYLLVQYIPDWPVEEEMRGVAAASLRELSRAEASLGPLAEGFELLCALVGEDPSDHVGSFALETAVAYAGALTTLAASSTNRRKLFSLAASKLLPSCLAVPLSAGSEQDPWSLAVSELLRACLLDERQTDELSKGPLPGAEGMAPVLSAARDKRQRVDPEPNDGAKCAPDPASKRSSAALQAYTAELFAVVGQAVSTQEHAAAGVTRLLQLFISQTMGRVGAGVGQESIAGQHRRAVAQTLHFALALLQACAGTMAGAGADTEADPGPRARCRAAVLGCLSAQLGATAIPDHPSLARYSALLRSLYDAFLSDLSEVPALYGDGASTQTEVVSALLDGLCFLVGVDHRPAVAGEPAGVLEALVGHLRCGGGGPGALRLLLALLRLHHSLRLLPGLIAAVFKGPGDAAPLAALLGGEDTQALLGRVTRGMPGAQLALCWTALEGAYADAAGSAERGGDMCGCLQLLQAWVGPLVGAYVYSGSGLRGEAPLSAALLPLLRQVHRVLLTERPADGPAKPAKGSKRKTPAAEPKPDPGDTWPAVRRSALSVADGLCALCAALAPHALSLARLPDPTGEGGSVLEWRAVYGLAADILGRLSARPDSEAVSCGLTLFTLLVTVDAVRDSRVLLEPEPEAAVPGRSGSGPSALLAALLHACTAGLSPVLCALLLQRLSVWAHLLAARRLPPALAVDKTDQGRLKAFVSRLMEVAVETMLHAGPEESSARIVLRAVSGAPFLEHAGLSAGLAQAVAAARGPGDPSAALARLLCALPVELLESCVQFDGALLPAMRRCVERGVADGPLSAADGCAAVLAAVAGRGGLAAGGPDVLRLLAAVLSAEQRDETVGAAARRLLLRMLDAAIAPSGGGEAQSAEEVLQLVTSALSPQWRSLWGVGEDKAAGKAKPRKGQRDTRDRAASPVFIGVLKSVSGALVARFSAQIEGGGGGGDASALLRLVETFTGAYTAAAPAGPDVSPAQGLRQVLDAADVILSCARVLCAADASFECGDSARACLGAVRERAAVLYGAMVRSCGRMESDSRLSARALQAMGSVSLLLRATHRGEGASAHTPSAADAVAAAVQACVSACRAGPLGTAELAASRRGLQLAVRAALLGESCPRALLAVLRAASQPLFAMGGGSTAAFGAALVEGALLAVLDYPDRFGPAAYGDVSLVAVLDACCGVMQEASRLVDPSLLADDECFAEACSAVVDTWHSLLGALQLYQQRRAKAKVAAARGAKRHRRPSLPRAPAEDTPPSDGSGLLGARLQDTLDLWGAGCLRACADWLCRVGVSEVGAVAAASADDKESMYAFLERALRVSELAVSVQSDAHLNTTGGALAVLLRAAVATLCSHAQRWQTGRQWPGRGRALEAAVRQCSRLLAGVAACRALHKYIHLFAAVLVEVMAQFPSVCNTAAALGGSADARPDAEGSSSGSGIDVAPLMAGLFCMFDRCRTSKQRLQLFAAGGGSGPEARLLLADLHEMYLREYKFVGMA